MFMTTGLDYWTDYFEKTEMLPENHKMIKDHIRRIKAAGMSERTLLNHLQTLIQFGGWCKVLFTNLNENDILDYSDYLDTIKFAFGYKINKPKAVRKYKAGTKYAKLATVKAFLKGLNSEAAAAIKIKMQHNRKLPEDLLTQKDVENLLNNCMNNRDRALISVLYESGCRKGELLSIKIKNLVFDENGVIITIPEGKTGARRIRVVFAASSLREWLDVHPTKENRESPVFVSLREPYHTLSDSTFKDVG
jgi:integrase/recombinase XerD